MTTATDVNKTSGGITIVKLNAAPPPVPLHSSQSRPKLQNGSSSLNGNQDASPPVAPPRPTTPSQIGHHVVTIHTSSVTNAAAAAAAVGASAIASNNNSMPLSPVAAQQQQSAPPQPQHTGYTRRAKLGDSRSTGRLHSAGNTHRSMTRLNIAGEKYKCEIFQPRIIMFTSF